MKTTKKLLAVLFMLAAMHSYGQLDSTFGVNGYIKIDFANDFDSLTKVMLQSDGKILAVGFATQNGQRNFALTRVSSNGTLDNTFGNGGKVITDLGNNSQIYDASLQADGKIVATGCLTTNTGYNFLVARYLTNGNLDSTFGVNGLINTTSGSNPVNIFQSIVIQTDGKIIASGASASASWQNDTLVICRFNTDGSVDASFNPLAQSCGNAYGGIGANLQTDGKLVVVGNISGSSSFMRLNTDGSLDNTFGTNGLASVPSLNVTGFTLQPDGKIVGNTQVYGIGPDYFIGFRLNTDGSFDNSYGSGGMSDSVSFAAQFSWGASAIIQPDGKILAGGSIQNGSYSSGMVAERFNTDGTIDQTFGHNGGVSLPGTGLHNLGGSMCIQPDGKIIMGGTDSCFLSGNNPSTSADFVIYMVDNVVAPDSTVWPGDADANHIVDNNDLLPIGLAYDSIGPVRAVQGIVWQGDVATDWNDTLPAYSPSVNFKNADCNGDGIINADDTLAIVTNFGDTHAKTNNLPGAWRSGIPGMTLQFSQDTIYNNDTLTTNIFLGSQALPVNNIYGLAFTFNYDPLVVDSNYSQFYFIPSWLGDSTNSININRNFSTGQVKAAITRIDHTPRSGNGQLAVFRCIITTDNINGKDYSYYLNQQYISDITAVDQYGNRLSLNAGIDSDYVGWFVNGINQLSKPVMINVYPNPAGDLVRITSGSGMTDIRIIDIIGNEVQTIRSDNKLSETIDISRLAAGVYTVHVTSQSGAGTAKLIVSR